MALPCRPVWGSHLDAVAGFIERSGCHVPCFIRTEEPEEWATYFSTLLFNGNKVISKPMASRTVLLKDMLEAVSFAYENQDSVII